MFIRATLVRESKDDDTDEFTVALPSGEIVTFTRETNQVDIPVEEFLFSEKEPSKQNHDADDDVLGESKVTRRRHV